MAESATRSLTMAGRGGSESLKSHVALNLRSLAEAITIKISPGADSDSRLQTGRRLAAARDRDPYLRVAICRGS